MRILPAVMVLAAAAAAGCANEAASEPPHLNLMRLGAADAEMSEPADRLASVKASKVLSANAFERATGSRADPARLLSGD